MQLTLTTKIDIPQNVVEGVLTTAIEGGINYWATVRDVRRREDLTVWSAVVWDTEEASESFLLDADAMLKGIQRLHDAIMRGDVHPNSETGGQFMAHLSFDQETSGLDCVDVVCADAIVQFACFGELVFS